MHCIKKVTDDLLMIGGNDRRIALFENVYPVPDGISYNSYLLLDEKTVLLDTVDKSIRELFLENLEYGLGRRKLDYVVVNHMEPDHCAVLADVHRLHPEAKIVCNTKTLAMIRQFFDFDIDAVALIVKEGDTLPVGRHTLTFLMAPMVHWPEVMVTYDLTDKILFSADAFGTFGALSGTIFADELDFYGTKIAEARRYYTNIVGKYGAQVQALLKKASTVDINMICPLHGPVWREGIDGLIDKYVKWSTYTAEDRAVLILYASIYGDTENAAEILATKLVENGVRNISLYDVSVTDPSYLVAEAFRCSHIVFASATYNAGIFTNMELLLHELETHNFQNRTVAVIENGTWAPAAGSLIRNRLAALKNMTFVGETLSVRSSVKSCDFEKLETLAAQLADSLRGNFPEINAAPLEPSSFFKLSYGRFVLSAKNGEKDNGCIINTVLQVTDSPKRLLITVNKANYTHDLIVETAIFNVSVLTEGTPFKLFQHFGFQSGRNTDKFADFGDVGRSANGLLYLNKYSNAYFSCRVISSADYGTHTVFVADVTAACVLSADPSVTYDFYFKHIKPSPKPLEQKKGFVCKICGYVYEGETLPPDFVCPLCKHGASDFEPLQ